MNIKNLKEGIKFSRKYYKTEASGNIILKTVKSVSATGVDRISIGTYFHLFRFNRIFKKILI